MRYPSLALLIFSFACDNQSDLFNAQQMEIELTSQIQALNEKANLAPQDAMVFEELGRTYLRKAVFELKKTSLRTDSRLTFEKQRIRNLLLEARRSLTMAIELNPTAAANCVELGRAYLIEFAIDPDNFSEERATARYYFRRAVVLQPEMAGAWYNLALATDERRHEKEYLRKALGLDKEYAIAYAKLAKTLEDDSTTKFLETYSKAKTFAKKDPEALLELSSELASFISPAREEYKRSIKNVPSVIKFFVWFGVIFLQKDFFAAKVELLEQAYYLEPYNAQILSDLVTSCYWNRQLSKSLAYYSKLVKLNNNLFREPYYFNDPSFISWLSSSARKAFSDSYWAWLNLALQVESHEEAIGLLRKAVSIDSTRAIAHYLLGSIDFKKNELAGAEKHLQTADRLATEDHFTRVCTNQLLTLLYLKSRDFDKAIQSWKIAIGLDSAFTSEALRWGILGRRDNIEFYAANIKDFVKLGEKRQREFSASVCIANGWTAFRSGTGDLKEPILWFKTAIDWNPRSDEAFKALGEMYGFAGQKDKKIEALKKATKYDPSCVETYLKLAFELSSEYSSEESIAMLRKAERLGSHAAKEILHSKNNSKE